MLSHIVLLACRPELTSEQILPTLQLFARLKEQGIPQIVSFRCGANNSPESLNRGYNYAFILEFADSAGRDFYLNHPAHQQLASQQLLPLLVDGINSVLVFDF